MTLKVSTATETVQPVAHLPSQQPGFLVVLSLTLRVLCCCCRSWRNKVFNMVLLFQYSVVRPCLQSHRLLCNEQI